VKIGQNGIKYPKSIPNTTVLTSHEQQDIKDAILRNDGWAHSIRPARTKVGDKVIIIPDAKELKKHGDDAVGIVFTATSEPYEVASGDCEWTSE